MATRKRFNDDFPVPPNLPALAVVGLVPKVWPGAAAAQEGPLGRHVERERRRTHRQDHGPEARRERQDETTGTEGGRPSRRPAADAAATAAAADAADSDAIAAAAASPSGCSPRLAVVGPSAGSSAISALRRAPRAPLGLSRIENHPNVVVAASTATSPDPGSGGVVVRVTGPFASSGGASSSVPSNVAVVSLDDTIGGTKRAAGGGLGIVEGRSVVVRVSVSSEASIAEAAPPLRHGTGPHCLLLAGGRQRLRPCRWPRLPPSVFEPPEGWRGGGPRRGRRGGSGLGHRGRSPRRGAHSLVGPEKVNLRTHDGGQVNRSLRCRRHPAAEMLPQRRRRPATTPHGRQRSKQELPPATPAGGIASHREEEGERERSGVEECAGGHGEGVDRRHLGLAKDAKGRLFAVESAPKGPNLRRGGGGARKISGRRAKIVTELDCWRVRPRAT